MKYTIIRRVNPLMRLGGKMLIGIKDLLKLLSITVVSCCAVFVCALFLNFNADLAAISETVTQPAAKILYEAQRSMGKITCIVTGCCLILTSVVLLFFYIKNYIDSHCKELGILKALGYSNIRIAKHFYVFGICVLAGCLLGYMIALAYMPSFYRVQNEDNIFSELKLNFYPHLFICLVIVPFAAFSALSVLYAYFKLKMPVMDLLRDRKEYRPFKGKIREKEDDYSFLKAMRKGTLRGKKSLVFFIVFSAFCFSAMVQMSVSMYDIDSGTFAFMILSIGLILAFITLFLSLSVVIKSNSKSIAMMKVFGYGYRQCAGSILGGYRPFAYLGFAIGTVYQYALLKTVMTFVFSDVENMPVYEFDLKAFFITLPAFILLYELVLFLYSYIAGKLPVKLIMSE